MIHKTILILDAMSTQKKRTIDEISAATEIPRSTVHRIMQILQKEEVVIHTGKGYAMTPKLLSIGLRGIAEREVLDIAIPFMRQLSEATQETISFNVICGHERVCVYRIEGIQPITRNIRIGTKALLFLGSAGKVIASGLSLRERQNILEEYARKGVIEPGRIPELLQQAELASQQGYAVSSGERVQGSASIAVPIKDIMDNIVASLSISTLENRLTPENKRKYMAVLLDASRQIQQECFFH